MIDITGLNFDKEVLECNSGICGAASACTHKLLKQEALYEIHLKDTRSARVVVSALVLVI